MQMSQVHGGELCLPAGLVDEGLERLRPRHRWRCDAFLPGIGDWKDVWLLRDLWHFHFYGDVPLALVQGRERTYFEHFWNDFAADPKHAVRGVRAGFEYFRNFERDVQDFAQLGVA